MNKGLLAFLLVALVVIGGSFAKKHHKGNKHMASMAHSAAFARFKERFGVAYESQDEESARFEVFSTNMKRMQKFNAMDDNKPYGVTKFMDLTKEEFASRYLMPAANLTEVRPGGEKAELVEPAAALPDEFDWRTASKCVTNVKNQGQCGSCWTFSAIETIESVACLAGYPLTVLSEQQIVDCDHDGGVQGCNGGFPEDVYKYVESFGGVDTEQQYPYQAQDGTCQAKKDGMYKVPLTSWKWVSQSAGDENQMQQFLVKNSPLSIAADAESWQFYSGGVISASSCGQQLDHAIQITGYKVVNGQKAWTVRNSWGPNWGEGGYLYLAFGQNTCGLATHVTVPCIEGKDGSTRC